MKKLAYFLVLSPILLLGAVQAANAAVRVAVVNPRKIIAQAPEARSMRQNLKERFSSRRQALQSMQQKLQKEQKKFHKNESIMSSAQKKKTDQQLQTLQRKLHTKEQAFQRDVRQAEHKAFAKLDKRFSNVIREVAKRNHDDIVLSRGVAYATSKVDITDQVLAKLRQKAK